MEEQIAGPLSEDDLDRLVGLLARYASDELDQWELWRIESRYGPVYLSLSRSRPEGVSEDAYTTIWPRPGGPSARRPTTEI